MILVIFFAVLAAALMWQRYWVFAWIAATAAILTFFVLPVEWLLWCGVIVALIVAFTQTIETGMKTALGLLVIALIFVMLGIFSPTWIKGWDVDPSQLRHVEIRSPLVFPTPTATNADTDNDAGSRFDPAIKKMEEHN